MHNNYRSAWEQETLSPEADARIRRMLEASSCSGKHKETIPMKNIKRKIPKTTVAAIAAVIVLTVAALAVAVSRIELVIHRENGSHVIEFTPVDEEYIDLGTWYPEYIPEGYEESFISFVMDGSQVIHFENEDGDLISLEYQTAKASHQVYIDLARTQEDVTVNGLPATIFGESSLFWTNDERGIGFHLSGSVGKEELIAIAESITESDEKLIPTGEKKNALTLEQLGDYQPTTLPEGYEAAEFRTSPLEGEDDWYAYVHREYENRRHDMIYIVYETFRLESTVEDPAATILDYKTSEGNGVRTNVTIQGLPGILVENDSELVKLVWVDFEKGLTFFVFCDTITGEEAIAIAEGLTLY